MGVWHEIFNFRFFSWIIAPGPPSIPLGHFEFFREWMFFTSVNDTGDKLFTGVNDTGDKFIVDTGE